MTKFVAPFVMVGFGWQGVANVWAAGLALMAVIFFVFAKDDPSLVERRRTGAKPPSFAQQFAPLKNLQVWRFSLYYFFVFGAFVALALWLPHYLIDVYGVDVRTAAWRPPRSACRLASLFRAYGGHLSDKFGARSVMYWTFGFSMLFLFMLSYPPTDYVIQGKDGVIAFSTSMGLWPFIATLFALGFFMSLGKAAVFKHIPVYYPNNVGAVGGLVGMIGGLGGFVLPIAFGALLDLTGIYTSCFALLFVLVGIALTWMHLSIRAMERAAHGEVLDRLPQLPEMQPIHHPERTAMPRVLEDWRPEDATFWADKGRAVARRNLWLSIPALLLAFSVWMVWSMVVAKLPLIGFAFTPEQLFWLAALPALSGATLRIFYGFMVPIFGGRLWTTLSTASLLLPAIGIGYAVQNPETPYFIFLVLALLCGLGGPTSPLRWPTSATSSRRRKGQCARSERRPWQPRRQRHAVPGAAGHHRRCLWCRGRRGRGSAGWRHAVAAKRRLYLGAVHPGLDHRGVVGDERHSRCQGKFCPAISDLWPHAELADVRPLHRHLRQLHRLFGRLPAAVQDRFPDVNALQYVFLGRWSAR